MVPICRGNGAQHVVGDGKDRQAFLLRIATVAPVFHIGAGKSAVNMACRRVASSAKRDKQLKRMLDKLS